MVADERTNLIVLLANEVDAGLLSGDVPQRKRQRLLEKFRNGELKVLIATDVAARGLHIADVTHVFNYDLPQQAEDYVHRIGRTARAGQSGAAISFACEEYAFSLPEIESYVGHKLPALQITEELLPELNRPPRKPRKPPRGNQSRPNKKGAPRRRRSRARATKETLTP